MKNLKIKELLEKIDQYELIIQTNRNAQTVQHLIAFYNKAIEYYSALNDEKHFIYL